MRTPIHCILSLSLLAMSGCTTFQGAPRLPFDGKKVFAQAVTEDALKKLASVKTSGSEEERNEQVIQLIAAIDLSYTPFKQNFLAQRQHVGSIADALTLAMTIAGSLTPSAGVKNNYLQGIALVRGGTENYDKNYLLTQTVYALVAQMDASRKKKLEQIYKKMDRPLTEYPAMAAYNDVLDYYHAGTVLGAIMSIQSDARAKEQEAVENLGRMQSSRDAARNNAVTPP